MTDYLADAYPRLARQVPKLKLAELPTPVEAATLTLQGGTRPVAIKRDDLTGKLYGGNKVRKLEYLLHKARRRKAARRAARRAARKSSLPRR